MLPVDDHHETQNFEFFLAKKKCLLSLLTSREKGFSGREKHKQRQQQGSHRLLSPGDICE
jgi:hypothetical protein